MSKIGDLVKRHESLSQAIDHEAFKDNVEYVKKLAQTCLTDLDKVINDKPSKFFYNGLLAVIGSMKLMNKVIASLTKIAHNPIFNDEFREKFKSLEELGKQTKSLQARVERLGSQCEKSNLSDECIVETQAKLSNLAKEIKPVLEKIYQI